MNGWQFASKPRVPFCPRYKIQLHGLKWYLDPITGLYDSLSNPTYNARALELFYQANRMWDSFAWTHPHLGLLQVQFAEKLNIPAAPANGGGNLAPVEVQLKLYNPSYS